MQTSSGLAVPFPNHVTLRKEKTRRVDTSSRGGGICRKTRHREPFDDLAIMGERACPLHVVIGSHVEA